MRRVDYKWTLLLFLSVTFFIEQATRQVYSATLPQIKLELGATDAALGTVGSVFAAVFGFGLVASGLASDFLGRKRVLVVGTLLFSAAVLWAGFATGIAALIVGYGILNALGQCCIAPPSYSLISQYHDNTTRSTAMGIFQSALYLGILLASVFAGRLASAGGAGWRWAFWIFGGLGVVWALSMAKGMRNTAQVQVEGEKVSVGEALLELLRKPTAVLIALAFGMFIYASFGLRIWMTSFIARSFDGITLAAAAFHSVFWFYAGALSGMMLTARLIDRFGRNRPRIRLEVSALGLLLSAVPMVWVVSTTNLTTCCVALVVLGLTCGVYEAAHYPAMFDCIAPRYRSTTTGLTGCLAYLIGSLAPVVLGLLSEAFSLRVGLMSLSGFFAAGALLLLPGLLFFFKRDYVRQ